MSDQIKVPLGAARSWQESRSCAPMRIREPARMASTSASTAIFFGSGGCPSNRRATRVERTIRLSRPDKELLMASGRL